MCIRDRCGAATTCPALSFTWASSVRRVVVELNAKPAQGEMMLTSDNSAWMISFTRRTQPCISPMPSAQCRA
eukprot:1262060-Prorocentrum_lima.AAC.1